MKTRLSILFAFILFKSFAQTPVQTQIVTGLNKPVAFAIAPDGRYFLTLKAGQIKVYSAAGVSLGTFYSLSDSTYNNFERGLLGIELDPDFANNHYLYAYYIFRCCNPNYTGSVQEARVVRFTESGNVGTNPIHIFQKSLGTSIPGNHVGGNIHFRPSEPNQIYITIGDLATSSNAPLLDRPYGKVLRINKDGSIPTDNPFYDDGNPATGNDDRIWSYGHRNPFDFTFSTINDSLYISENGLNTWDELNYGMRGKNYGWPTCEGSYLNGSTTNLCSNAAFVDPIASWGAPLPSITGIIHYTGNAFLQYYGDVIIASNNDGYLYDVKLGNAPYYNTFVSKTLIMDVVSTSGEGLTTLRQGTDGCIYAMKGGYTTTGYISKLCPVNVGINEETNADLDWNISPNIISDKKVSLNITLPTESQINFSIVSVTGQEVFNYNSQNNIHGTYKQSFELSGNLSSGIYFAKLSLTGKDGVKTSARKIVIE